VHFQKHEGGEVVCQEIRRLLAESDSLSGFLSTPLFIDPRLHRSYSMSGLAPGDILAGRFRIIDFIAAGGMGEYSKQKTCAPTESSFLNSSPRNWLETHNL
jgi:hypothetical protein